MEILLELLLTAFVSVVFAFLLAKLISLASDPDLDRDLAVVDPSRFPVSAEKIDGREAATVREIYGELLKDFRRDGVGLGERSSEDVKFCEYLAKRGIKEVDSACDSERIGVEEGNGVGLAKSGDMDAEEAKDLEIDGEFGVGSVKEELRSKEDEFEGKEERKSEKDGESDVGWAEEVSRSSKNEFEEKEDGRIDGDGGFGVRLVKEMSKSSPSNEDEFKEKEEKKSESDGHEFDGGLVEEEVKSKKEGFDAVDFARSNVADEGIGNEKGNLFNEEDEWEAIERSELEKRFGAMVSMFALGSGGDILPMIATDVQMQLYGLQKVATEGPCYEPQPSLLKVSARAKWHAWQRLGNMNPDVAMEEYINLLSDSLPGWIGEKPDDNNNGEEADGSLKEPVGGSKPPVLNSSLHDLSSESERNPEVHACVSKVDDIGGVNSSNKDIL